jgi:hypothetical protein
MATTRPDTGATARPGSGSSSRPGTGTTYRVGAEYSTQYADTDYNTRGTTTAAQSTTPRP